MALFALSLAAQKVTPNELIALSANPADPKFSAALQETLTTAAIDKGTAVTSEGPNFIGAVHSKEAPEVTVDSTPAGTAKRVGNSDLWFYAGRFKTGMSHAVEFRVAGNRIGGSYDVAALGPESYPKPGVTEGKLTPQMVFTSKLYDGMTSNYWVYTPSQYDPAKPAALMVWHDGQGKIKHGPGTILTTTDNLTAEGKIPVMVQVFVQPGMLNGKAMRSIEYDTVNDRYARFLRDELLPEVYKSYNIRKDAYSRAAGGESSGGISAFTIAWFQPDQFSRVLSRIGSFTSIQWHPGELDGGNVYPFMIRKQDKRNIRVWLQDGAEDLENEHGSWPLQNIQMANSLKRKEYDFHLSFGTGTHNGAHGSSEIAEELIWLWRDYDPAKTDQVYQMDAAEKDKPFFRVKIYNR